MKQERLWDSDENYDYKEKIVVEEKEKRKKNTKRVIYLKLASCSTLAMTLYDMAMIMIMKTK